MTTKKSQDAVSIRAVLTPQRLGAMLFVCALLFVGAIAVLQSGRNLLRKEVQQRSVSLATMLAQEVSAQDLESIRSVEDMEGPAFQRVVSYFRRAKESNPDILFVYTMRPAFEAGPNQWRFIVDADPTDEDKDGDGVISDEEKGAPPSLIYDGTESPMMTEALKGPSFDKEFKQDDWGELLSGYAPVINPATGKAVAVLGVDVPERLVGERLFWLRFAAVGTFLATIPLVIASMLGYFAKTTALACIHELDAKVQEQNLILVAANDRLADTVGALKEREREMSIELNLARQVQERFLPNSFPFADSLAFASHYRACSDIGGDLYDVFPLGSKWVGMAIADVAGHGVSAALVTAILKVSIERHLPALQLSLRSEIDPQRTSGVIEKALAKFVTELNQSLIGTMSEGTFVTFMLAVLDVETGELLIANAGHNPPVRWSAERATAEAIPLPANIPLGLFGDYVFKVTTVRVTAGDKVVLYTDGIVEYMDEKEEQFGMERLVDAVRASANDTVDETLFRITQEARTFANDLAPDDDQAVLIFEYRATERPGESLPDREVS